MISQRKPGLWENPVSLWVAVAPIEPRGFSAGASVCCEHFLGSLVCFWPTPRPPEASFLSFSHLHCDRPLHIHSRVLCGIYIVPGQTSSGENCR